MFYFHSKKKKSPVLSTVHHSIILKHWDKLASYTYSMTAHSPTLLIHTDYATLPTQCGKTDKDDQYTQTHTDPTVHVMWQSTCTATSMVSCLFLVHWWALCSNKLTTFNLEVRTVLSLWCDMFLVLQWKRFSVNCAWWSVNCPVPTQYHDKAYKRHAGPPCPLNTLHFVYRNCISSRGR